ncbi:hypothetical protein OG21DRAFT_381947 [Imleria badia]|nr:hypothetical protein OG21DRAFT_381947 [Imleria badia]
MAVLALASRLGTFDTLAPSPQFPSHISPVRPPAFRSMPSLLAPCRPSICPAVAAMPRFILSSYMRARYTQRSRQMYACYR